MCFCDYRKACLRLGGRNKSRRPSGAVTWISVEDVLHDIFAVNKRQLHVKISQKLLNAQMNILPLSLPFFLFLFKDLCEQPRVNTSFTEISSTICSVFLIKYQASFLQLVESQFCKRLNVPNVRFFFLHHISLLSV